MGTKHTYCGGVFFPQRTSLRNVADLGVGGAYLKPGIAGGTIRRGVSSKGCSREGSFSKTGGGRNTLRLFG